MKYSFDFPKKVFPQKNITQHLFVSSGKSNQQEIL